MARKARVHYFSLRSSLVNLPISIYGPLHERGVRPQHLAVHLSLVDNPQVEAYVGWSGMSSAASLAKFTSPNPDTAFETIDIDPQFAQGLGLKEDDVVEIGLLHDLSFAKSVATEPISSDDWEIIEINASYVESTLLSQVRVAKVGQEIDVWVMNRTRVRLRITSMDPPTSKGALLLTTDTEVSIAPKLRRNDGAKKPTVTTIPQAPEAPTQPAPTRRVLRVMPDHLLSSSAQHSPLSGQESQVLAYVSLQTYQQLQSSEDLAAVRNACLDATYKVIDSPVDPTSTPPPTLEPEPNTKVLHPGKEDTTEPISTPTETIIRIGWTEGVPNGHIAFFAGASGIDEWDLVAVSPTNHITTVPPLFTEAHGQVPSELISDGLAGVDGILQDCVSFSVASIAWQSIQNSVQGVPALLLTGRPGSGKTSIAKAVAANLRSDTRILAYSHYVDASQFTEKPIATLKSLFKYWFDKCSWHQPSLLIIDNMDKLFGPEVEHQDSFRKRHVVELFIRLYSSAARSASRNARGILLFGIAESTSSIHPLLNTMHIFSKTIHIKPPNKEARKDILAKVLERRLKNSGNVQLDPDNPLNYAALATLTEGYSASDLNDLVTRAMHQVAMRLSHAKPESNETFIALNDFTAAQKDFVPLSLRDVPLQKSDIQWADIGGLEETKRVLRETLEWPTKYAQIFVQSPLRLRSGLLLYGYPGCGKTLLASAVAKECGLNFISVKGPELLNKYIGASEKSVRDLFERASAAKPCVLFFDEFDSIAPKRGHDSTGVTDRVVNQMLTQMDGAEGLEGVYVLAATSRPDLIDSALLRPGRLDKSLLCDMPNKTERKQILEAVSRKLKLAPFVDLDEVADATSGYSGADLQALIYNAHLEVVHESISIPGSVEKVETKQELEKPLQYVAFGARQKTKVRSKADSSAFVKRLEQIISPSPVDRKATSSSSPASQKHEITQEHLRKVLKTTQPSVSREEIVRLERIYRTFAGDRDPSITEPVAAGIGNRVSLA